LSFSAALRAMAGRTTRSPSPKLRSCASSSSLTLRPSSTVYFGPAQAPSNSATAAVLLTFASRFHISPPPGAVMLLLFKPPPPGWPGTRHKLCK